MYAKLVFPTTVTAGQAIRDIVRLIRDSGTGTASLANLQYITVGSSELIAGTNSGWTIHTSTPLNTGAQSITDNRYILQGTCANGVAKYVGIYANWDWTNAGSWSSTTTPGFTLGAVQDPGTATVWYGAGYNGTTLNVTRYNCLWPNNSTVNAGGTYDCTLYIFADPRRIVIIGVDGWGSSHHQASFEFAPTPVSTTWKGLPPVAYWRRSISGGSSTTSTFDTAFGFRGSTYENQQAWGPLLQFPGSLWSVAANAVVRSGNYWHGGYSINSTSGDFRAVFTANGTTNGLGQSTSNIVANGFQGSTGPDWWAETNDKEFWGGIYTNAGTSNQVALHWASSRRTYDSSGNIALPLYPIVFKDFHCYAEIFNFSSVNGIYWTFNGQGQRNDTVTAGADVWHYFPMSNNAWNAAFIIKRT